MKRMTMILALAVAAFGISTQGQGFMNLDFESAQNLTNNPGHGVLVAVTNALPGWTVYVGLNALASIDYETNFADLGGIVQLVGGSLALSGNFSVYLGDSGAISQTRMVPGDAESLLFWAYGSGNSIEGDGLTVTLGGQTLGGDETDPRLPLSILSQYPNYTVYGVNIPADLTGQMEELTFFTQGAASGNLLLDNIEFSPVSVPEPSEVALVSLAAILFGLYHRRKHQRHEL